MVHRADCLVIGAGVVGLAVASALAVAGRDVVIIERDTAIGTGVSSRNSEVIHAGIYYPAGSDKARLCVEGRQALYDFCARHGVAHRRCGKLIVGSHSGQIADLERLLERGLGNGVDDLHLIDGAAASVLEPAIHCVAALHSPSTGIIDSHGLMLALLGVAEDHGAMLALGSRVIDLTPENDRIVVTTADGTRLDAALVVNAAGLSAAALAATLVALPLHWRPAPLFAKGSYFSLIGRSPFSRLIYPIPEPGGLGVHLTLDLAGAARFGPDVEWLTMTDPDLIDYDVDPGRAAAFLGAIRHWWPDLAADRIAPSYAGVRPKLTNAGVIADDFQIAGPADHGVPGYIGLSGIESPGLTASLAIAARVATMAMQTR